ncbi:MAG TPA: hypothetical protein VI854_03710, partial [Acidimicrobiia bacterium]|nr:hypothetical protein [Acidimicrobiia bacterium]
PDDPLEPVTPRDSPSGGTSTIDLPRDGTDCGFPSAPEKIDQPLETRYIGETSGMVASPRYPGVYWTIRDSGHTPAVNAVRIDANGIATTKEIMVDGAFNGDWEEINYTTGRDGRGRLWVVESGQPGMYRQIYEIFEPDPDTDTTATIANVYDYAWPGDRSYNTEASFMHKGRLIILSKTTPHARMYRFETLTPGTLNVPVYIGELGNSKDVSVVRQSPDGKYLVTASHQVVHLYKSTDGSGSLNSFNGRLPDCELMSFPDQVAPERGGNVEGGEFSSNRTMVFMDELKVVYRLRLEG